MRSVRDVLAGLPTSSKKSEGDESDIMANPDYLRKSSSLISESLQKGFDVLQLENGDVVVTGTKTIVTQYSWDDKKGKMAKVTGKGRGRRKAVDTDDSDDE